MYDLDSLNDSCLAWKLLKKQLELYKERRGSDKYFFQNLGLSVLQYLLVVYQP